MELQSHHTSFKLLHHRRSAMRIASPKKAKIHRPCFGGLKHLSSVERPTQIDSDGDGSQRSPDHGRDAARERMFDKTCAIEMDMNVDRAWRGNQAFAIAYSRSRRDDQLRIDVVH